MLRQFLPKVNPENHYNFNRLLSKCKPTKNTNHSILHHDQPFSLKKLVPTSQPVVHTLTRRVVTFSKQCNPSARGRPSSSGRSPTKQTYKSPPWDYTTESCKTHPSCQPLCFQSISVRHLHAVHMANVRSIKLPPPTSTERPIVTFKPDKLKPKQHTELFQPHHIKNGA